MILLSPPHHPLLAHRQPSSFSALMDLYECNYINIRRLAPTLPYQPITLTSHIPGGLNLYLQIIERFRYTTEINLTYHFVENGTILAEPNLRIRIYHDARLAEVLQAQLRHFPAFDAEFSSCPPQTDVIPLYWRWRINRFLFKWLSYCLRQGHRFLLPPSLSDFPLGDA